MISRNKHICYPIYTRDFTLVERIGRKTGILPIRCNICGSVTLMRIHDDNFRETCVCFKCHSTNRQRQIAHVLCNSVSDRPVRSLKDFVKKNNLSIYNTEAGGVLHSYLSLMTNYISSEYLSDEYESGKLIDGVMHQDLMNLSFEDNQFDLILSTDVFEHIADPYIAHQEVLRVLKPGGRHIFTVPFHQTEFLDEKLASINDDNKIEYYKEPVYHYDPIRVDGILVFNIFSIEMLSKLSKLGFRTNMYLLYNPFLGILGFNGLVFESIKT